MLVALVPAAFVSAQVNLPEVTAEIPNMAFPAAGSQTVDLRDHFGLDFVEPGNPDRSTIIQFTVKTGDVDEVFNILLFPRSIAPQTVDNFLAYVDGGLYDNVIFHRRTSFALQGGGYFPEYPAGFPENFPTGEPTDKVETFDPIPLEYNLPNRRGRVAMARTTNPDSATSQFFFNLIDNSGNLGPGSDGFGFATFANVMSFGMDSIVRIARIPVFNGGGVFQELPLADFDSSLGVDPTPEQFVTMTSVRRAEVYPGGTLPAVLSYEVVSSVPSVATAAIVDNQLTVTATGTTGISYITVTATDTSLAEASETFIVNVGNVPPQPSAFASLSTRAAVIGDNAIPIVGFTIAGPDPKRVLVRTVGPTLLQLGVPDALLAPTMTLTRVLPTGNEQIAVNDDWETNENVDEIILVTSQVGAFPLIPNFGDAAVLETLVPGTYTVTAAGLNNFTGVCLVEMYDADLSLNNSRFTAISSRVPIAGGSGIAIPGFSVTGTGTRTYLIRAAGPGLRNLGIPDAISNPRLQVMWYQPSGDIALGANDDWEDDDAAAVTAATQATGVFPFATGSLDAALVIDLQPGVYTVLVSGVGGALGTGLVEVYEVP